MSRAPIIDTTRTVQIVAAAEYFGDCEERVDGFIIVVRCPVDGIYDMPGTYPTRDAADAAIAHFF